MPTSVPIWSPTPPPIKDSGTGLCKRVTSTKLVFCNRYTIFWTDIKPCGLRPIAMDGFLTGPVVQDVKRVLSDRDYRRQMVNHN